MAYENFKICYTCVSELYLQELIKSRGKRGKCNYCHKTRRTFDIGHVSDLIDQAFQQYYVRTSNEPEPWEYALMNDPESEYYFTREGQPVIDAIEEAAGIPMQAAKDIQSLLKDKYYDFEASTMYEETEFDSDTYYAFRNFKGEFWKHRWDKFENIIKTESRYFNNDGADLLKSVFSNLELLSLVGTDKLFLTAGTGEELNKLYRARVFQTEDKLKDALSFPDKSIGSPPSRLAMSGRMNAHGISVFYGADKDSIAISEVRPPVGSYVVVAIFNIIRPLKLLDLTSISKLNLKGSIFSSEFAEQLERVAFLRNLSSRITRPVLPDDEDFDYLITQAIADYLSSNNALQCDGIIYSSVQSGDGRNVVLFHKAALVDCVVLEEGTEMETNLDFDYEEGPEIYITTTELTPSKENIEDQKEHVTKTKFDFTTTDEIEKDRRIPSLRIDLHTIVVHSIKAVTFITEEHPVHRYKMENMKSYFRPNGDDLLNEW